MYVWKMPFSESSVRRTSIGTMPSSLVRVRSIISTTPARAFALSGCMSNPLMMRY